MSGTAEVLQEYLVKLGYKVNPQDQKKFVDALGVVGKRVLGVGTAVAGVVAGVEAAAANFAYSMRRVYFDSQLANSSVKNLQSLEYAGNQVGISATAMGGAIHNMAQALRLNPGLQGVIESFGIKVTGRDVSDVMTDYVKALGKMPEFQASQFASMFGMDPDTYHQFREHADEIIAKQKQMKDVYSALGVDMDDAAKTSKHYADSLDNVKMHLDALEKSVLVGVLPAFDKFTSSVVKNMDIVTKWLNLPSRESGWDALMMAMGLKSGHNSWTIFGGDGGGVKLSAHAAAGVRAGLTSGGLKYEGGLPTLSPSDASALAAALGGTAAPVAAAAASGDQGAALAALERQYGLAPGMLSRVFQIESASGRNAGFSSAGALGPFQFMKDTGKDYGLLTDADRMDFGKSSVAAAKYLSALMSHYGGDVDKSLAAYNWGQGNVDRFGMNRLPAETSGYLRQYHGLESVAVQNTFYITGSNATEIANKVAGAQSRTVQDALRNGQSAVR